MIVSLTVTYSAYTRGTKKHFDRIGHELTAYDKKGVKPLNKYQKIEIKLQKL